MPVERDWRDVTYTPQNDRLYHLGDPTLTIHPNLDGSCPADEDREMSIRIQSAFGRLRVFPKGTVGGLSGLKVYADGVLEMFTSTAKVHTSEPDKLILIAESCDGVTMPLSFSIS